MGQAVTFDSVFKLKTKVGAPNEETIHAQTHIKSRLGPILPKSSR